MSYSQKNSRFMFYSLAVLVSTASLACWQFYEYVTFKHDNGLFNIDGGVSHLVWAVLFAFVACGVGFVIASKLVRNTFDDQLHITSGSRTPPNRR